MPPYLKCSAPSSRLRPGILPPEHSRSTLPDYRRKQALTTAPRAIASNGGPSVRGYGHFLLLASVYQWIEEIMNRRILQNGIFAVVGATYIVTAVLWAQTTANDVPAWQSAAGGKRAFEVASVKPSKAFKLPNFDLSTGNAVAPGGRFSAGFPLLIYITFAYKLQQTDKQRQALLAMLPPWANTDFFEIEARAAGNASKDQMRLMMQSLLADRFKLAVHFETRDEPVLALTLEKPGKLGPKLRPHSEGPACPEYKAVDPAARPEPVKAGAVFPPQCDVTLLSGEREGLLRLGARNMTMPLLADTVQLNGSQSGEVDKPVVDRTGLNGTFDYTIEYGRTTGPVPSPGGNAPAPPEATFLQAVRQQLGLKLVPSRAPIRTIVIDHVERPSGN